MHINNTLGGDYMQAGVSSACLYPEILEDSIESLAKLGIKNMELFVNSDCELTTTYITEVKHILDFYGSSCRSIHPFTAPIEPMLFFSAYERRVQDGIEYYKKYFNAMNILGAKILVLHGNKSIVPVEESLYFDRFYRLYSAGKQFGVTVAQENVARCQCNNIPFIQHMIQQLGKDANFVIDLKQAIRSNLDVFEVFDTVKDNLAHVHISDSNQYKDCLPLGKGTFDIPKLIDTLKSYSFNGYIMVELYRNNFKSVKDLNESYIYLSDIIKHSYER